MTATPCWRLVEAQRGQIGSLRQLPELGGLDPGRVYVPVWVALGAVSHRRGLHCL